MICAAGRDLAEDPEEMERWHALLASPKKGNGAGAYRFAPREIDAAFFCKWVQELGATRLRPVDSADGAEPEGEASAFSESQTRIIANRDMITAWLESLGAQGRRDFFRYLQSSTEVAVHTWGTLDEARNAHASTHSRGLAQDEVDKLKAELLGDCAEEVRARLAGIWEECEAKLGKEPLTDLLHCLVFIESERKPQHSLEADLVKVFDLPAGVETFIEERMVPAAEAYERILKAGTAKGGLTQATTPEGRRARRIDGLLVTLRRATHTTWKGPALLGLMRLRGKALETFLADLERLAAVLMIVGVDPNQALFRYAAVVHALKSRKMPQAASLIQIEAPLLAKARGFIVDPRAGSRDRERYRMPVLLKLNDLLNGAVAAIDPRLVSCEHILPRSAWRTPWNRIFRNSKGGYIGRDYVDRLGNLAILTHRDNCDADTKLFEVKRKILKASGFPLSKDVAKQKAWTPKVVEARTARLAEMLIKHWRLS
jgi:hypothetical protein